MTSTGPDADMRRTLETLHALARPPAPLEPTAAGPLSGMSVAVKDNIAVGGLPHEGASPALAGHVARADAGCVARLRAAGAGVAFQTNLHELAFGITSANAHTGVVLNPWNPTHVAGGSSGGTAVAVATGAVVAGLGTDTGGSGRIPAAFCGCVGLRPTTGRYPGDGVLTLSSSFDTVSAMATDVTTLRAVDEVLAGDVDDESRTTLDPDDIVLGVAPEPFWSGVSAAVAARSRTEIASLEQAGVRTVEVRDPALKRIADIVAGIALPLVVAEASAFWQAFARERLGIELAELVERIASPDVAGVFSMVAGAAEDADALRALVEQRDEAREAMDAVFERQGVHALVHPAGPTSAPSLDELSSIDIDGVSHDTFTAFTEARLIASVTATPALVVPTGLDDAALPRALELLGRGGADWRLLNVGAVAEATFAPMPRPSVARG